MKNLVLVLSVFCLIAISSCTKTDRCSDLVCVDDCEFVEVDRLGVVHYYGCYLTWGALFTDDAGELIIGLAPDMIDDYKVEDMEITFSATFFENDLPLAFPDPMPGRFYRMEICNMEGNEN